MIDEFCIGFHASEAVGSAELEGIETEGDPSPPPPPPQPVSNAQIVKSVHVDNARMDWFLSSFLM